MYVVLPRRSPGLRLCARRRSRNESGVVVNDALAGFGLDRLARTGRPERQPLPRPSLPGLEYSFSGLKTALLYRLRDLGEGAGPEQRADLAAWCALLTDD